MSFINKYNDLADFERFFYDQISFRTDFFEEPDPKMRHLGEFATLCFVVVDCILQVYHLWQIAEQ